MVRTISMAGTGPGGRQQVRAIYTHHGNADTQLEFKDGDVLTMIGDARNGWQYGENMRTNALGWFPLSFTEPLYTGSADGHVVMGGGGHTRLLGHQRVKSLGNLKELTNEETYHMPSSLSAMGNMARGQPGAYSDSDSGHGRDADLHHQQQQQQRPLSMVHQSVSAQYSHGSPLTPSKYPGSIPNMMMPEPHTHQPPPPMDPPLPPPPPPPPPPPGPPTQSPRMPQSPQPHPPAPPTHPPPPPTTRLMHAMSSQALMSVAPTTKPPPPPTAPTPPRPMYEHHPRMMEQPGYGYATSRHPPPPHHHGQQHPGHPPQQSPGNSSSGYSSSANGGGGGGQNHMPGTSSSNQFSNVTLKRTTTNDRSAPRLN